MLRIPLIYLSTRESPDSGRVGHFWVSQVAGWDFSQQFSLHTPGLLYVLCLYANIVFLCGSDVTVASKLLDILELQRYKKGFGL